MENKVKHLGIIMDGNRRWAKKNKMKSILIGHDTGARKLLDVCKWCKNAGIEYLSVYAFSTENWNRSKEEINGLFQLMNKFFNQELDTFIKEDINIKILGNRSLLHKTEITTIEKVEEATSLCKTLRLNIALSYGGHDEILRAVTKCFDDIKKQNISIEDINEETFSNYLDTQGCPNIDMVIRTGGNRRLSNFFPWQTAYAELYFSDILWPDFNKTLFDEALRYYENTNINNGK